MALFENKDTASEALNWNEDLVGFLENIWEHTEPYHDPDFRPRMNQVALAIKENPVLKDAVPEKRCTDARHQAFQLFHQLYWEMHCILVCLELELPIVPYSERPSKGPDILLEYSDFRKVWIECVAPTEGTGANRVPALSESNSAPVDLISLRYTSGLNEKRNKLVDQYLPNSIVDQVDAYIVAINGVNVWDTDSDFPGLAPAILRCLYGIGRLVVPFSDSGASSEPFYEVLDAVQGPSGNEISNNFFSLDTFQCITGVLFSRANPANRKKPLLDTLLAIPNNRSTTEFPFELLDKLSWYEVCFPSEGTGKIILHPRE